MNNKSGMASHYRYGNCLNDQCKLGGPGRQVQKLSSHQDFICQECGKPLHECPPPKNGPGKSTIIGAAAGAAAVLGILGFGAYKFLGSEKDAAPTVIEQPTVAVSPTETTDTVGKVVRLHATATPEGGTISWSSSDDKVATVTEFGEVELLKEGEVSITCTFNDSLTAVAHIKAVRKATTSDSKHTGKRTYNIGYGTYSGPMNDGEPDGYGGEIRVGRSYYIDLMNGEKLTVSPGDKIVNCKFRRGKLVQGFLKRSNGEGRDFMTGIVE